VKIASVDIGTNTCNLLIADLSKDTGPEFIHKDKKAITLINNLDYNKNNISDNSIDRLVGVIHSYQNKISEIGAEKTIITATSGIRSAKNKQHVINVLKEKTGLDVEVIDGQREAELVYTGVNNAIKLSDDPYIIIDIGGGSIEFIIGKSNEIIFKESFKIGVARILNTYKFSDPLNDKDLIIIEKILTDNLLDMLLLCKKLNVRCLVGSSGSYETFSDLIKYEFDLPKIRKTDPFNIIDIEYFFKIHQKLINYDYEQRKNMPGMEIIRVQLIPIASVITNFIIRELDIKKIIQSNFSIKEGLIFDYISKNILTERK